MIRHVICGVLFFVLGITVILGHVKVYERRLALEEKYEYLLELQSRLGEERKARIEQVGRQEGNSEGRYEPLPEDYIIVYVRETAEP